ncbi:MAG TPA: glycosyltransferase family 4 protein [Kineosporiaceae bacterium]|nr:glycosyltransferase family 4 protein [Kineosporiaceae bacterium]
MRILHVSDAYLPKQGGIEVQVHDLATRQAEAGHEVTVLTCAPEHRAGTNRSTDAVPDAATTRVHAPAGARAVPGVGGREGSGDAADGTEPEPQVRVRRVRVPWGRIRRTNTTLRRLIRDEQVEVVHAHLSVLSPLSILAVRTAAKDGVPVVATLHSLWWFATPLYAIADLVVRWSHWPVQWTAVSELAAEPMRGVLRGRAEVSILPNGIDPGAWLVEPQPREADDVLVVTVMRLAARKRPRALLKAFRQALDQLPAGIRLRLVVIGDGPLRPKLERDVARLRLTGQVELRGAQRRDQIRELYRRADLYIAPAVLESFGIAALEARSAGLPVIARAQTGIADFIRHREHGLLARDDAGLAAALAELATTPQQRARMSATSRATAPEWGWGEVLQRCDLAYKVAHEVSGTRR